MTPHQRCPKHSLQGRLWRSWLWLLSFSISIGVAEYNHSMANIDDLISEADQALYQAKHSGRDQVRGHRIPQPA